ncbi:MAG: glycine--tRNA ligase subunit beta [Acidobacteria bacterium]|nr:glycine--tRNA ligase subunit beta [Acidobacteriota bacterium]
MPLDFLLEIGSEEIPDWMIEPALEHLKGAFTKLLADHKLKGGVAWVDATPRRLVVQLTGLPKGQKDSVETVSGPPKSAGEGAAMGFARKMGVTPEQLETVTTDKGEYFCFKRKLVGKPTGEILAAALPGLILGIPWPKNMYWLGKGTPRFIRPIRWMVALLGPKVVEFEVTGVKSGAATMGHRRLAKSKKPVKVSIKNYEQKLLENFVVVRAEARRRKIEAGIADLLAGTGLRVKPDAALADTLCYITEYPTPILGSFAESYLTLPAEVLVTVMRHHQKYFSVVREDGSLAPHFIAVMNTESDSEGFVRAGNERVLRARFNDARFFYDVDQKKPLAERVADLKHVTFQKDIGSYFDKVKRMETMLAGMDARRACELCKCDLTTDMVKEFTDLQGLVGGIYARAQGESEAVAQAIYEHYKPLSMEDSIPATLAGQQLALADKMDTLTECFRVGLIPTGSKDPFALRRAAQGAVKILVEGALETKLHELIASDALKTFFEDRVRYYFRDCKGYAYDEVNAAMACGWSDLKDLAARLEALKAVRPTEDFEPLAASFKRVKNILEQAAFTGGVIDAGQLTDEAERNLHAAMGALELSGLGYHEQLERIATLRPVLDQFFDKVLVNAPEPHVRQNRLALLHHLRSEFSRIADFSEIVTSSN